MVLPISMRLKGHKTFEHLIKYGLKHHGNTMIIRVVEAKPQLLRPLKRKFQSNTTKFAVSISKKVSKRAVVRNQIRRRLHHHLKNRLLNSTTNPTRWFLISLKPYSSNQDIQPLLEDCDKLLVKAGFFP